ncbi:MAG: hypothetical protein ACNA8W_24785, partial [Bradymonadaceae bacterium]
MTRWTALLLFVALAACGPVDDDVVNEKGEEDMALTDGKSDSFFNPTVHGTLRFGDDHTAELTEDTLFHSWEFDLDDDASISLWTGGQQDLDTVMYLYSRQPGEAFWGRYIAKNDDFDGSVWSRIDLDGEAGQYRVIIKGFKQILRGEFVLSSSCSGDGCPDEQALCDAGQVGSLPAEGFDATCGDRYLDIVAASTDESKTEDFSIDLGDRCIIDGVAGRALELYQSYWGELYGPNFNEQNDSFPVSVTTRTQVSAESAGSGKIVVVASASGDDMITFVFDAEDRLISLIPHDEPHDTRFFCRGGQETVPFCTDLALAGLTHVEDQRESGSGTTSATDAYDELPWLFEHAVTEFAWSVEISEFASIAYDYVFWRNESGLQGGR